MTVRLSVTAEPDIRESGEVSAVIASLSSALWWREGDADLVAVSGGVGWTERVEAHITAGARGILVVEPVAVTAEQLARVRARCAVPVVIEWPYVVDPALAMVVPDPLVVVASGDLIECRMVVPVHTQLERTLVGHLAFARSALGSAFATARALEWSEHGYTVLARIADGRRCLLTAAATGTQPPHAAVRFVADCGEIELTVPEAHLGRAARLSVETAQGVQLVPIMYERAHRAPWRRLHALVARGAKSSDLGEFGGESSLAWGITGTA